MKLPSALFPIVALITLSCGQNQQTSETASPDSLAVQTVSNESVPVSSQSQPQQINNFPDYSSALLTEDELDRTITEGIDELVAASNSIEFLTYHSYYTREREYQGEYDAVTETQEVTETWFFDLNYKLRAYSKKYYRDGEGRETRVLTCIFSGDSLLALSDWQLDDGQIGVTSHRKLLASKCPKCGVDTNREGSDTGKVNEVLSDADLEIAQSMYVTHPSDLSDETIWANAQQSGDGYNAKEQVEVWSDSDNAPAGKPYVVEHTMSKDLYEYCQFKSLINLFNSPNSAIPKGIASLFLEGEEMASYSTVEVLEDESGYFLLYNKSRPVGPGVVDLYALSFTKNGELMNNLLAATSYPSAGPDGDGEDYTYEYDSEKHVLTVTNIKTVWDKSKDEEVRKDTKVLYKLNKDCSIDSPSTRGF